MTRIVGLDLSLTATGIAVGDHPDDVTVVKTQASWPMGRRLAHIRDKTVSATRGADLVIIEGPFSGGRGPSGPRIGMVHGAVRVALWERQTPVLIAPPTSLKKLATGKGNAGKPDMLAAAIRRLGWEGATDDNAIDALFLYILGHTWWWQHKEGGLGSDPWDLPKAHLAALDKLPDEATL